MRRIAARGSRAWSWLLGAAALAAAAEESPGPATPAPAALAAFERAESLADRAVGAARAARRREMLLELAEAVRLDEALGSSAVLLALAIEEDPLRRGHLERLAAGLDRGRAGSSAAEAAAIAAAIDTSRFLAKVRQGDRREAQRLLDRPGVEAAIAEARRIERARGAAVLPDFDAWRTGRTERAVGLDEAQRRATLELEMALLDRGGTGLGVGRWLDGGLPLPEIDARGLAEWFEAAAAAP